MKTIPIHHRVFVKSRVKNIAHVFLSGVLMLSFAPQSRAGDDFRQENVDAILSRIKTKLTQSIDADDWKGKYSLVSKNIEDLRETLRLGGKISSNPVLNHSNLLDKMLKERRNDFEAFCAAQEKLESNRKKAAKKAIANVGGELISRITPKPGVLTPLTQARTRNARIIKRDFARLKTINGAINYLESLKESIKPSMRAIRDRSHAMPPLVAQFKSLKTGFDGSYRGRITGGSSGLLTFTVKGRRVSGHVKGTHDGDGISAKFNGTVDTLGHMETTLIGTLTDNANNLGTFSFQGSLNGNLIGPSGSGRWTAKNIWGKASGKWSAVNKQ